jgi:prolyl 4-hydroxylase
MKNLLFTLLMLAWSCTAELNSLGQEMYDYDNSWAIKSDTLDSILGNKQELYNGYMNECRESVGPKVAQYACDEAEASRIRMNRLQPMGMRNYTELGFAKIRAPEEVFSLIAKFWELNGNLAATEWKATNPYHNMWAAPPTLVNVQDESIPGGGPTLQNQIWESSRKVMEEWTGQHLAPCSMWGIRIYPNNSILAPHVDRNPLVTSAIINVAQDVDEDWPLEVWGHDGKVYNISMKPGDMVLYESHSILHGTLQSTRHLSISFPSSPTHLIFTQIYTIYNRPPISNARKILCQHLCSL